MDYLTLLNLLLEEEKQEALAKELGTSQATISRWLRGQEPKGPMIEKIKQLAANRGLAEDTQAYKMPKKGPGFYSLDIRAGMGGGGALSVLTDGDGVPDLSDGVWTMPDRVAALFRNPGKTYVLPVAGDSNEPTIRGGSFVFVDTDQNFPRDPDFYACDAGDGLVIKRLELIPRSEMIWVRSDNEAYDDYELRREDVLVFGRVVAVFQWRG